MKLDMGQIDLKEQAQGQLPSMLMMVLGEMSRNIRGIARVVAEELAIEYCSCHRDIMSKEVKGFFLNKLYRSWGLSAQRDGHGSSSTAAI